MSSQTRPSFFCSRPNGTLTPLIAVDDLPTNVFVRDVPRTLTPGDTQGMTSCGVAPARTDPLVVEATGPASLFASTHNDALNDLHATLSGVMADTTVPAHHRANIQRVLHFIAETPTWSTAHGSNHNGNHGYANGNNNNGRGGYNNRRGYNNGRGYNHGNGRNNRNNGHKNGNDKGGKGDCVTSPKKKFCSFWIRHGECDYLQQGCIFQHIMPTTLEGLEQLGLRDIPRWYREKYGVPSLLTGQVIRVHNPPVVRPALAPAPPAANSTLFNTASQQREDNGRNNRNYRAPGPNGGRPRPNNRIWNNNGPRNNNEAGNGIPWTQFTHSPPAANSAPSNGNELVLANGRNMGSQFDLLSTEPAPDHSTGHVPREPMSSTGLQCRPSNVSREEAYRHVPGVSGEKEFFRHKSRFMFTFPDDSQASNRGNTEAAPLQETSSSPLSQLVAESDPIDPNELLLNFGAVGDPVVRPPSAQSIEGGVPLEFPVIYSPRGARPASTYFYNNGQRNSKPAPK